MLKKNKTNKNKHKRALIYNDLIECYSMKVRQRGLWEALVGDTGNKKRLLKAEVVSIRTKR